MISRRLFLKQAAAAGLTLWLPGCGSSNGADVTPAQFAPLDDLARRLAGPLLLPAAPGYAEAVEVSNARFPSRPQAVAMVTGAEDVRQAILWARQQGVELVARSGGHSYGGFSSTMGLCVNTRLLNEVSVADGVATVGAGAINREIYAGLEPTGRAVPAGRCPTVAAGGLVLGGGFGFSSRKLGLTSDCLVDTEIVTADGQILTASASENPDLFWACQGGGGGNFGINTRFRLVTSPVGEVVFYRLSWDWSQAFNVLSTLQTLALPADASCRAGINGGLRVNMLGQSFGSESELRAALAPLLALGANADIRTVSFWEGRTLFFDTTPVDAYAVKSLFVEGPLPEAAIRAALARMESWPGTSNPDGGGMAMFRWGSQLNVPDPPATAFVHRRATWLLAMSAGWEPGDATAGAAQDWLRGLYAEMRPFGNGHAYQNFIDPEQPDFLEAYYGTNLPRLREVKRRYDPDNFFRFPQSIPL